MPCTCCSGTQRHLEHYGYQNFNFQLKHSTLNTYHVCFLLGFCNKECIHHKIFAEKQKNYRNFFAHLFVSPWPSTYSRTTSSPVFLITLLSFLELLSRWTQVTAMGNPACHSLQQRHQPCMALEGLMDNVQNSLRELLALYKNFSCQRRTHVDVVASVAWPLSSLSYMLHPWLCILKQLCLSSDWLPRDTQQHSVSVRGQGLNPEFIIEKSWSKLLAKNPNSSQQVPPDSLGKVL